jgi:hypothetical protein
MPALPTALRCNTPEGNDGHAEACRVKADPLFEATREPAASMAAELGIRMANIRAHTRAPAMVQT